jgi:AcrR family transcriptional regulator
MTTALDNGAHVTDADPFRDRLLDGLAASIGERGYRDTTVADIVRHARTSKRTFYEQFASKEECLIEVLRRNNENLIANIRAATDPDRPGGRRLRRPHRIAAGDHAELDPGGARARCEGPAAESVGNGAPYRHARRSQRQPGLPARRAAADLAAVGADPAGRIA